MAIAEIFVSWRKLPIDAASGPPHSRMKVCVARPGRDVYTETFIRAHMERLPAEVIGLHGDSTPIFTDQGEPLLPRPQCWVNRAAASWRGVPAEQVHTLVARAYPAALREKILAAHLRRKRVEVVLAEYGTTGVAIMDACRRTGVPLVVHFHGYDAYSESTLECEGRRYPDLFDAAAAIIAVSHDMERQLLSLGAPRGRLHYNPYGVDIELFNRAQPAHASPLFVAVGRFVDKKAPHLTLLAFKAVADRVPDASLVMVGDGPLLDACKQLSEALGLADAVHFPGARPHPEVAEILRCGRAFVQHSVRAGDGDSEGTPVAILEAAACGLPVVATRHGGIPDVVLDGETGILVGERNIEDMAKAMLHLAEDPMRAAELGATARARVRAMFAMERSILGLMRIIEVAANRS